MAKNRRVSLRSGRPPVLKLSTVSITRKASRAVINKHHQLEKSRVLALKQGDKVKATALQVEIDAFGGLNFYQKASLQGQSKDRGGDSSVLLLQWLGLNKKANRLEGNDQLHMLEVGALSTKNFCSQSGCFEMTRIDLNSQEPGILQQDFMKRPLPERNNDKFDVLSLSLVVNFVPDPVGRGEMLRRALSFLRDPMADCQASCKDQLPVLFLVLPRSCIDNSRYCTDQRLLDIMTALGFTRLQEKKTNKLVYQLWKRTSPELMTAVFHKEELNPGSARNNFSIVLHRSKK